MMRAILPSTGEAGSIEGDRGDRRRRIGADAGQGAQFGLALRKGAAAPRDFARAGVHVARPRIIAEPGEGAHDVFQRRGGEVFDARPERREAFEIGDDRLDSRLLQQDFGEPDEIGVGALRRARPARAACADGDPTSARTRRAIGGDCAVAIAEG